MLSSTAPRKAIATRAAARPACLEAPQLFQHRLLEEPPTLSSMTADERRTAAVLARQAEEKCLDCPMMTACLYDAVVKHDVAGFVAGTTHRQRMEMRARLGVHVDPENLDTLAGVTAAHRQVNHDEVVRLRKANPHESLEMIAQRLGCSLSTVKRHLRRACAEASPQLTRVMPTRDDVLDTWVAVTTKGARVSRAA